MCAAGGGQGRQCGSGGKAALCAGLPVTQEGCAEILGRHLPQESLLLCISRQLCAEVLQIRESYMSALHIGVKSQTLPRPEVPEIAFFALGCRPDSFSLDGTARA